MKTSRRECTVSPPTCDRSSQRSGDINTAVLTKQEVFCTRDSNRSLAQGDFDILIVVVVYSLLDDGAINIIIILLSLLTVRDCDKKVDHFHGDNTDGLARKFHDYIQS